jgi:hypothetical protein
MEKTKMEKMTMEKIELLCYKGEANAETWEKAIKENGFNWELMQMFQDYYANDFEVNAKRFPK